MANKITGGPAKPIIETTTGKVQGGPAKPAYIIRSGDGIREEGGPAQPVRVITDPNYPRHMGGPAIPVYRSSANSKRIGGPALPIYYVAGPTLYGPELLANGNMETGSPPTGWVGSNAVLASVADARPGSLGMKSLDISITVGQTVATAIYDSEPLILGRIYLLSFWYKVSAGTGAPAYAVHSGTYGHLFASGFPPAQNSWTYFSQTFVCTEAGLAHVHVSVIGVATVDHIRYDDVSVREILYTENLIVNGSFDTDVNNWTMVNGIAASVAGGLSGNCMILQNTTGQSYAYQRIMVKAGTYQLIISQKNSSQVGYVSISQLPGGFDLVNQLLTSAVWATSAIEIVIPFDNPYINIWVNDIAVGMATFYDEIKLIRMIL